MLFFSSISLKVYCGNSARGSEGVTYRTVYGCKILRKWNIVAATMVRMGLPRGATYGCKILHR